MNLHTPRAVAHDHTHTPPHASRPRPGQFDSRGSVTQPGICHPQRRKCLGAEGHVRDVRHHADVAQLGPRGAEVHGDHLWGCPGGGRARWGNGDHATKRWGWGGRVTAIRLLGGGGFHRLTSASVVQPNHNQNNNP